MRGSGVSDAPVREALQVASARSLQEVLKPLGSRFAEDTGTPVEYFFGPVGTVQQRLDGGAAADVVILSKSLIDAYAEAGRVLAERRREIGRVGIMVAVREGAEAPDVSTPDLFKAALLKARAIACSDPAIGGSAGTHFAALLKQFGIEEQVRDKLLKRPSGVKAAEAVASGDADIGITLLPEMLPVQGRAGRRAAAASIAEIHDLCRGIDFRLPDAGRRPRLHRRCRRSDPGRGLDGCRRRAALTEAPIPHKPHVTVQPRSCGALNGVLLSHQ